MTHAVTQQLQHSAFEFVFSEFKLKQQGLSEFALHTQVKQNYPPTDNLACGLVVTPSADRSAHSHLLF